ncbi:hypothetical protein O181_046524 [Austropuccinia psidii MF-1]|uniref:Uncharacterized protein n=1 Tax=Austropuccinia psidii MF-1 TaxID=1389203 RepID=A0A9Q3DP27_9BASI|nr:hypothetical protein [Austropuccinia psidii MF-1]
MDLRSYPASLALLDDCQPDQPQGQYLSIWAWGVIQSSSGPWLLKAYPGPPAHPLLLGVYHLNGIFEPFGPHAASTARGPWDSLSPFWLNSNEAKRGQGGSPAAPKPEGGPP